MSRAVGNGALDTISKAIGSGKINENTADIQGIMDVTYGNGADAAHLVEKSGTDYASPALIEIHHQISDLQAPEKTSGLMFNPETGKLYIPCGNGITVNKATGMLEALIGEHLQYTGSGLDVPDADEATAGVVKLTHEVSDRDDGDWAITADGVYAYAKPLKSNEQKLLKITANPLISGFNPIYYANGIIISGSLHAKDGTANTNEILRVEGFNAAMTSGQLNWVSSGLGQMFGENWFMRNDGNDFVIYSGHSETHSITTAGTAAITLMFSVPGNLTI